MLLEVVVVVVAAMVLRGEESCRSRESVNNEDGVNGGSCGDWC